MGNESSFEVMTVPNGLDSILSGNLWIEHLL